MASTGSGSASSGGFGNLTAFIDQGSEFEGKLSFKDTVRIDGSFSGEISSDNTLIVGESGQILATIKSVAVVISGLVEGDIHASEQIVLHNSIGAYAGVLYKAVELMPANGIIGQPGLK